MANQKSTFFIIISGFAIYTFYYNVHYNNTFKNINENYETRKVRSREPIYDYSGTEDFLINTPGCYIPNYGKTLVFKESPEYIGNCGERAVFIKRVEKDEIVFQIDTKIMKKHSKIKDVYCCYMFATRSNKTGSEDTHLRYTNCKRFKNGEKIALEQEILKVICDNSEKSLNKRGGSFVYEDAYAFVKKLPSENATTTEKTWNVLMVGMDTMSRARLFSSMPKTVKYLQKHEWLDYRGYQKVGYNTFPNLMAILTGKKLSLIYKKCANGMQACNDLIIWSRFREAGYITAYGEDYLTLPDTFSRYKGFRTPPTHHYMRPLFLTGEKQSGNLICTKHKPSAKHLLDYASEFANTYKNDKFFGAFWLNSYSHNLYNIPTLLDNDMVSFFENLNETGVLNNTIVMFLSDHGIRYGDMRVPIESYYEERLPMFSVWIPHEFRKLHEEKYYNLQLNQNRLVTPYDIYVTLTEISNGMKHFSDGESEACPQCTSIFEGKSPNRTCADAGVIKKWCSCHDMTEVDSKESGAKASLQLAVKYIKNITHSVETIACMACSPLQLDKVLRSHTYVDSDKIHYVVAWQMVPGNVSFEATVEKDGDNFTIIQPTDTISAYNVRGNCVKNPNYRPFCVCKTTKCVKDKR